MIIRRASRCLAALSILAFSHAVAAQNPSYPVQPAGQPVASPPTPAPATAIRVMRATRAPSSITIDGKLNEPAWAAAVPSGDFTQSYPNVGAKATDPTELR